MNTIGIRNLIVLAILGLGLAAGPATAGHLDLVVALQGTATGESRDIEGVEMDCFDADMVNPRTGRSVGTASDCLDLASIAAIGDDGGFAINNTTFFNFVDGTVVSLSRTTIQPVEDAADGPTHVTGEVSSEDNILAHLGTGAFTGRTGRTRLSGMVDMSDFGGNTITFDCIFVIDVD